MAWLDMKDNRLDVVIGPVETYEDKLYGYKAAFEAFVLVKDLEWSKRLGRYAAMLPELQRGLPVPDAYKAETPGTDSDLNAYDVIYYAGDCNAGSKTIAINLPNDEQVQLEKGTRRLQLKNAMRAKFDAIMVPIAAELIVPEQRRHVTFDAFFANTMFHEVAHGLGIKNTVDGKGTVRDALKELGSGIEEGTKLAEPIFEFFLKSDALHDPLVNDDHIRVLGWATSDEIAQMKALTHKVNGVLKPLFAGAGIDLVDYKLEFGHTLDDPKGPVVLGDEFTPDGCRLWDATTGEKMDKDRFRRDLGSVIEHYREVARRIGVPL